MTLRSCGSVSELRRRSRVRASRKRKRSADVPGALVQLLAVLFGSLIVSKRNHFTLGADRHSVHRDKSTPTLSVIFAFLMFSLVVCMLGCLMMFHRCV